MLRLMKRDMLRFDGKSFNLKRCLKDVLIKLLTKMITYDMIINGFETMPKTVGAEGIPEA